MSQNVSKCRKMSLEFVYYNIIIVSYNKFSNSNKSSSGMSCFLLWRFLCKR
uniref:Uncharacterized protein n=1 Tax=Siphoviridae sp. ctYM922 TaxID=2825547 RepID=A0A8S5U946_9CAUD|nr:MAG TPA: hypothetical protein [Siphoviridae sp. ctYM922]